MNFYKHHIGDYAQATAHLSFAEDAAYSRLLRKYYAEEVPIPADLKAAQRLVAARTREEKDAVETVLEEFFDLQPDGWHNKRADEEIAKANAQADANRRVAADREARRRARQANEDGTNRPGSGNDSSNDSFNDSSPSREPSQTPDTRHQTRAGRGEEIDPSTAEPAHPAAPGAAGAICGAMRAAGLAKCNPGDQRLHDAIAAGCTTAEFVTTTRDALGHDPPKGFAWIVATTHGRRRDRTSGAPHAPARNRTSLADQVRDPRTARDDGDVLEGTATRVANR